MRLFTAVTAFCGLLLPGSLVCADGKTSRVAATSEFNPPQVFKNTNLVRNTNLEKGYVRETVNVIVENVDKQPQSNYYLPFPSDVFDKVGSLEVRDKKAPQKGRFDVEAVDVNFRSDLQYLLIHFPEALAPKSQVTLGISYTFLNSLNPRPAAIGQSDRQFLAYSFSGFTLSAYPTITQKTKLKFPSSRVPDFTVTEGLKTESGPDPERQGATYTYGPYDTSKVAPGTTYPISVRYEFTKPVITASLLERDLEVSHWGGNLATEERYWLRNNGSHLSNQFSRVEWTIASYQQLPSSALRELKYPLKAGSADPYFIDDVGNVSTSKFRPGNAIRGAHLELRPRYPVFGNWNYSFKIGWNNGLSSFLRTAANSAASYVLKVPFIEGPKASEGIQYENIQVRVALPEGSRNVQFELVEGSSSNGLPGPNQIQSHVSTHKTYMDTLGRTVLTLNVENLSDEARDSQLVITYDYTLWDGLRKPFTITAGLLAVFAAVWFVGNLDVSIKKR